MQSASAMKEERLPGSREVLELSIGRLKYLQGDHQKGGFTQLVLTWAAIVGDRTSVLIGEALSYSSWHTKCSTSVMKWEQLFLFKYVAETQHYDDSCCILTSTKRLTLGMNYETHTFDNAVLYWSVGINKIYCCCGVDV